MPHNEFVDPVRISGDDGLGECLWTASDLFAVASPSSPPSTPPAHNGHDAQPRTDEPPESTHRLPVFRWFLVAAELAE
jgi:hypothetical protein